jgi:hypothetical protein
MLALLGRASSVGVWRQLSVLLISRRTNADATQANTLGRIVLEQLGLIGEHLARFSVAHIDISLQRLVRGQNCKWPFGATHVCLGSWSCENALAEALTRRDLDGVARYDHFSEFSGFSVWNCA